MGDYLIVSSDPLDERYHYAEICESQADDCGLVQAQALQATYNPS